MKRNSLVFFLVFSLICVAAADERAGKALQVTETGKESFEADFVSGGAVKDAHSLRRPASDWERRKQDSS